MLQATPDQLVFVRDMILKPSFIAYREAVRLREQKIIDKNNQFENKNRKPHTFRIRDKLLVRNKKANNYEEPYVGPCLTIQVWNNGNVNIGRGDMQECINNNNKMSLRQ